MASQGPIDIDAALAQGDLAEDGRAFTLDRKRPAAQQVYSDLRARIIDMDLPPGMSLSRHALAAHYGVSQTPIRDSVMKLEQEGLVEIYPQSRTLVARIDVESAGETQFLRLAIELEVVRRLALGKSETAIPALRENLRLQKQAAVEGDVRVFMRLDQAFHGMLHEAAGRRGLSRLILQRSGHLDRLRRLHLPTKGKMSDTVAQHAAIVDAIEAGDEAAAAEAVRAHLSGTLSAVKQIRAMHPDYF